jgi:Zn-dependent protease with chaperone function
VSTFAGTLYDGRNAVRHAVEVELAGPTVTLVRDGERMDFARDDVKVDAAVPGVARRLVLPGGAVVETAASAAVDAAWPPPRSLQHAALWLESRTSMAIGAVVLTAALVALLVAVVVPLAADPLARRISPKISKALSDSALRTLDGGWLKPSTLPDERTEAIDDEFAALAKASGTPAQLEFRAMSQPNAFALPDGTIVLTDEMVAFTRNNDELMAVLAHELGHVHHAHSLRMLLRQSAVAVMVTALAGDAAGMTILAVILPSALLDGRYSREFELDADAFAQDLLRRTGRSPQVFTAVLRRFAADPRRADAGDPLSRYLSSHPALEERIERAEKAR